MDRLTEAGWVEASIESEDLLDIKWTEKGKVSVLHLKPMLDSIGYDLTKKELQWLGCLMEHYTVPKPKSSDR
jgi:hypothetical protein